MNAFDPHALPLQPAYGFHADLRALSAAIEHELATREVAFPAVLDLSLRIRHAANDPEASVERVARLIRVEPVLSARVVRMANSVIYNRAGRRIGSVAEAIPRIGLANLRVLALVVAMDQLAQEHRSRPMRTLAIGVWRHAVDVGAWAFALARACHVDAPDSALLAGLMTDIGVLCTVARAGQYPAVCDDMDAFAEIARLWNDALTQTIVERMDLPADVAAALEPQFDAIPAWPPATLREVLHVATLVTTTPRPLNPADGVRERAVSELRERAGGTVFDALLASADALRADLVAILRD